MTQPDKPGVCPFCNGRHAYDEICAARLAVAMPRSPEPGGASGSIMPCAFVESDDGGETVLAIASMPGKVIMDFGAPVTWIGMAPEHAERLAARLIDAAAKARVGSKAGT